MALSNAERQQRFRQRLKARASGVNLGEQAAEVVDAAYEAVWAILNRPAPGGGIWGDTDEFADLLDYKQHFRDSAIDALPMLEQWLYPDEETEITEGERSAIARAVELHKAVLLHHVPLKEKPKRVSRPSNRVRKPRRPTTGGN